MVLLLQDRRLRWLIATGNVVPSRLRNLLADTIERDLRRHRGSPVSEVVRRELKYVDKLIRDVEVSLDLGARVRAAGECFGGNYGRLEKILQVLRWYRGELMKFLRPVVPEAEQFPEPDLRFVASGGGG